MHTRGELSCAMLSGTWQPRAHRIPCQAIVEPARAPPSLEPEPAGLEIHSEHLENSKLHPHLVVLARASRWWHPRVHIGFFAEKFLPQGLHGRGILLRPGRADAEQHRDGETQNHDVERGRVHRTKGLLHGWGRGGSSKMGLRNISLQTKGNSNIR